MKNNLKRILIVEIIIIIFALGFLGGFYLHDTLRYGVSSEFEAPLLAEARAILIANHLLEPPSDQELEYGMISGLLGAYNDPYTYFLEPVQHELESNRLSGEFGGIGATLERDAENNVVLHPFEDGPAFEAGIESGDILIQVEQLVITPDTPTEEIIAELRGPVGRRVEIIIRRPPNQTPQTYTIKRAKFPIPSVVYHPVAGQPLAGLVDINRISSTTPTEVEDAIYILQNKGVEAIILDLRGNGGGILSAGVDIARLFLSEGLVIERDGRNEDLYQYEVERPGPFVDIPLIVLVDHNTASASEVIAGALQVHGRATLVGEPTYGKNTIQFIYELSDGSSIHVTGAQWWVPNLTFPNGDVGLFADLPPNYDDGSPDPGISQALRVLFGE